MKPIVLMTRPLGWDKHSKPLDIRYVPVAGDKPRRKNNKPAPDGHYAIITDAGASLLIKEMRRLKPQFLLRWVNTKLSKTILARVREASPKTIIFCADGNQPESMSDHIYNFKEFIDVPLLNSRNKIAIDRYRAIGFKHVDTLYEAFFPRDFRKNVEPRFDCFFGGSNRRRRGKDSPSGQRGWIWDFPNGRFRYDLMQNLHRKFSLLLCGPGKEWPQSKQGVRHGVKYYDSFRLARVAIGCNHYDLERYYTRRMFHAGGCGRLFVTKYIPGMEKDGFRNEKNIVWFETVHDALHLIKKYQSHKKEYQQVVLAGQKFFTRLHSWKARMHDFEKIVKRIL